MSKVKQTDRFIIALKITETEAAYARLLAQGQPLAQERVALALAGYQAGRGDLSGVLTARRDAVETRLRLIDLDTQRAALRVRHSTLISE